MQKKSEASFELLVKRANLLEKLLPEIRMRLPLEGKFETGGFG